MHSIRIHGYMAAPILDHMSALSDQTRCRMLLLLEKPRADGVGAVRGSADAAVERQPPSEDAGRRRLGRLAARRDEPVLQHAGLDDLDPGARRLWPLIREQVARHVGGGAGRSPAERRARRGGARSRRSSSPPRPAEWDRLRSDLFGDTFFLWARARPHRSDARRRRSGLRHRPADRDRGALRAAGDGGGRLGGHARRRARAARRRGQRRAAAGRAREPADRATASWMRRCCRWCCTTRRRRRARWPKWAAWCGRAAACWSWTCCRTSTQEYQQQMGHVWLGFSEKQITRFSHGRGLRRRAGPDAAGRSGRERAGAVCGGRQSSSRAVVVTQASRRRRSRSPSSGEEQMATASERRTHTTWPRRPVAFRTRWPT